MKRLNASLYRNVIRRHTYTSGPYLVTMSWSTRIYCLGYPHFFFYHYTTRFAKWTNVIISRLCRVASRYLSTGTCKFHVWLG